MTSLLPALAAACLLAGCAAAPAPADTRDQFMATLQGMCGQRFEGALSYAIDPNSEFADKKISTEVVCTADGVRMPVQVGENRSRTWIFTRPAAGLELRHDHRHPDGTPDAVTMYGGMAKEGGTARSQAFLADAYTARLVPGAETNVWTVSLSQDGKVLTYRLDRHDKPRAEFVLKRVGG
ncbi:hypothetical protein [Massilia sp. BSC265]|uniref:hypothetical protein n=1 Tax=Massilia sp. BSC265 TaxID=1549812 RepID=UPI0004E8B767|nr:hypothetical protein [Massilia sp. BSC265]KFI07862.1 hypothetical protein JN27_07225 [Massilia sp. BSC265]